MENSTRGLVLGFAALFLMFSLSALATAQDAVTVLAGAELTRVVPPGFYFQGLSAPTQMRNSAAARFGTKRFVVAGLVDTSGYAADVRAKYEGFLITDSPLAINGSALVAGAYGFGFTNDDKGRRWNPILQRQRLCYDFRKMNRERSNETAFLL